MPNTIDITTSGQTYHLGADGTVQTAATGPWGNWAVNADNSVTLTPTKPEAVLNFSATWSFLNQDLMVALTPKPVGGSAGGAAAPVNVCAAFPALSYEIDSATGNLVVEPAGNSAPSFTFVLVGAWNLTATYCLQFTPTGGTASVITGRVYDLNSQFNYGFDGTANGSSYYLIFPGEWSLNLVNADIQILFTFPWNDPATGQKQVLKLDDAALSVDTKSSLLQVKYDSGGATPGWQILLVGKATITNGIFATYELIDENGNLTGTKFDISAKVGGNLAPGTLDFSLKDENGNWVPVLTYTGNVSVGTAKGNVAFTIQPNAPGQSFLPLDVNLTGSFSMKDGARTVQLKVDSSGLTLSISTGAIKFGSGGSVWSTVSVTDTGNTVDFSMLFGFSC